MYSAPVNASLSGCLLELTFPAAPPASGSIALGGTAGGSAAFTLGNGYYLASERAVHFDRNTVATVTSSALQMTQGSIAAWVRWTDAAWMQPYGQMITSLGVANAGPWLAITPSSTLLYQVGKQVAVLAADVPATVPMPLGAWTHVVITFPTAAGGAVHLYVNGQPRAQAAVTASWSLAAGTTMCVGGPEQAGVWDGLRGDLFSLQVYDRILSAGEVQQLATGVIPTSTTSPSPSSSASPSVLPSPSSVLSASPSPSASASVSPAASTAGVVIPQPLLDIRFPSAPPSSGNIYGGGSLNSSVSVTLGSGGSYLASEAAVHLAGNGLLTVNEPGLLTASGTIALRLRWTTAAWTQSYGQRVVGLYTDVSAGPYLTVYPSSTFLYQIPSGVGALSADMPRTVAVPFSAWTHVAITYTQLVDGRACLYVDGGLAGNTSVNTAWSYAAGTPLRIGGPYRGGYFDGLQGDIQLLQVYGTALSPQQIAALAAAATPPTPTVSPTASPSVSGSISRSPSVTGSASGSTSTTASTTPSATASSSSSASDSLSATATASSTASPSDSSSTSPTASATASVSASAAASRSGSASKSLTSSDTASGSGSASVSPSLSVPPSPSASATISASASPSFVVSALLPSSSSAATATTTASLSTAASVTTTPAPSTAVRIAARFESPLHSAFDNPSSSQTRSGAAAASALPSGLIPVTVASVGLPLPVLRIALAEGCIGADAATLTCSVGGVLSAASPHLPVVALGAADFSAAAGPLLRLSPQSAVRLLPPRPGACIPLDVAFTLIPHRSWPTRSRASSDSLPCEDSVQVNTTVGAMSLPVAAAYAYAQPAASVVGIRCELNAADISTSDAGSLSATLAVTQAAVLVADAAIPVIRDAFLLRRSITSSLLSLRSGASAAVEAGDRLFFDTSGSLGRLDALQLQDNATTRLAGVSSSVTAQLTLHHAIAAVASRSLASSSKASSAGELAVATPVVGRTVMVVALDTRVSLHRPSLVVATQLASDYSAAAAAMRAGNVSSASNATVSGSHRPFGCTASARAVTAALLTAVAPPRLRLVVRIGGIRCRMLWSSPDGSQVHVETPSLAELCSSADASSGRVASAAAAAGSGCGHQSISLAYEADGVAAATATHRQLASAVSGSSNSTVALPSAESWVRSWLANGGAWMSAPSSEAASAHQQLSSLLANVSKSPLTRAVSCPPWCPSAVPQDSVPLAVAGSTDGSAGWSQQGEPEPLWQGVLVPASVASQADGDVSAGRELIAQTGFTAAGTGGAGSGGSSGGGTSGGGLYYTSDCAAAGFVSAEAGVCSNVSDPLHRMCAFTDAAGECQPCPANAYCPGGRRAIPYRGFYTTTESSGAI